MPLTTMEAAAVTAEPEPVILRLHLPAEQAQAAAEVGELAQVMSQAMGPLVLRLEAIPEARPLLVVLRELLVALAETGQVPPQASLTVGPEAAVVELQLALPPALAAMAGRMAAVGEGVEQASMGTTPGPVGPAEVES